MKFREIVSPDSVESLRNYEMDDHGDLVLSAKWDIPADEEITISSFVRKFGPVRGIKDTEET